MNPLVVIAVAIGGAVGTLARISIDLALSPELSGDMVSILAVNVVGALLLGLAQGHGMASLPDWMKEGVATGVLGSFTTMSGIALVTLSIPAPLGLAYVIGTFVLGVAAAGVGWLFGQRLRPRGVNS